MNDRFARWLCDGLIEIGGAFVPVARREDWRREWRAEVDATWSSSSTADRNRTVRRCFGAIPDGVTIAWLRFSPEVTLASLTDAFFESVRGPGRFAAHLAASFLVIVCASLSLGWVAEELARGRPEARTRFVVLHNRWEAGRGSGLFPFSVAEFVALRDRTASIPEIAAYARSESRWTAPGGERRAATVVTCSADFLEIARVRLLRGRGFTRADESPDAESAVILGAACWKKEFLAERGVLGTCVEIDGTMRRVIGVAESSRGIVSDADFWIPLRMNSAEPGPANARSLRLVGTRSPDVEAREARAEIAALLARVPIVGGADPRDSFDRVRVEDAGVRASRRDRARLAFLGGSLVSLVLVARCLASGLSLDGTRAPFSRQIVLLVPAAALAICAVRALGAPSALWVDAIRPAPVTLTLACAASALLFLLAGIRSSLRVPFARCLQPMSLALACALFVVTAIGVWRVARPTLRSAGFEERGVVLAGIRFESGDAESCAELARRIPARLGEIPGVQGAAFGTASPYGRNAGSVSFAPEDRIDASPVGSRVASIEEADYDFVEPGYFDALRIAVRGAGRPGPGRVIVNEALARRLEPNGEVLGRGIRIPARERRFVVVGVVRDTAPTPCVYFAFGGTEGTSVPAPSWGTVLVRATDPAPRDLHRAVKGALREVDPEILVAGALTVREARARALFGRLREAPALAATCALALSLAGAAVRGRRPRAGAFRSRPPSVSSV